MPSLDLADEDIPNADAGTHNIPDLDELVMVYMYLYITIPTRKQT